MGRKGDRIMSATDKRDEFVCISYGNGYVELFMTLDQIKSIATIGGERPCSRGSIKRPYY